jgi:L-iditol 2-dehydrogenase
MTVRAMQASFLYGIRDMRLESHPLPDPGPGEVLLEVAAVGVCGSDVHYYLDGRIGGLTITEPLILGHEFSARVTRLGEGVQGPRPGDLVTVDPGISCGHCESCQQGHPNLCPSVRFCGTPPVNGVFAEYAVMPAENCHLLPEGIGMLEGALLEPLGIAVHSVNLAKLKPGDTAAVLGAGPIGLLTAAVARAAGASTVYMTDPLAYRREFALRYAADAVFDPDAVDAAAEIRRETGGRGVDVVFEAAGAPETPQQAAEAVRVGGRVVLAGIPAEDEVMMRASSMRRKGLTIKMVRRMKHIYPRALRLVQTGQVDLKSLITHSFPLSQVGQAMELVAGYRDGVIKAVIQVGAE